LDPRTYCTRIDRYIQEAQVRLSAGEVDAALTALRCAVELAETNAPHSSAASTLELVALIKLLHQCKRAAGHTAGSADRAHELTVRVLHVSRGDAKDTQPCGEGVGPSEHVFVH